MIYLADEKGPTVGKLENWERVITEFGESRE